MFEVYSQFKRPKRVGEKMSPKSKTEQSGYREKSVIIDEFLNGGIPMPTVNRKYEHDGKEDIDIHTIPLNPTQNADYDLVDAARDFKTGIQQGISTKEKRDKEEEEAKAALDKIQAEADAKKEEILLKKLKGELKNDSSV